MDIRLYNSLSRRTETFVPADPQRVTLYVCGPTVYNYAHIGNARPFLMFGLLAKLLRRHFPRLIYARNITDVDDKINTAAQELGVPISVITERYTAAFHEDMAGLGIEPPDVEPRATAHIGAIIAMIETLIERGHAYAADGHALFDVESFPAYGQLSGRSRDEMIAGARVEVAPYKRNPGDFVLWKPSTLEQPGWESPWGRGRPGWHIECSAMSEAHLGETLDIHAGGNDLTFPHHENELAQSTCAHGGKTFSRYWLHNGFVTIEGRKMSKSLGNVLSIKQLRDQVPAEALRFLLLKAHYRQPLDWSAAALGQALRTLDGIYGVLRDLADVEVTEAEQTIPADFEAALCDDLNTPEAFAALARLADQARRAQSPAEKHAAKAALLGAGDLVGLLRHDPEAWFKRAAPGEVTVDADQVERLIAERNAARAGRDFARGDAIRNQLAAMGVQIEDGAQGTRWKVMNADDRAA